MEESDSDNPITNYNTQSINSVKALKYLVCTRAYKVVRKQTGIGHIQGYDI